MPIVLAVNGIVETYPAKLMTHRQASVESVVAQGDQDRRPPLSDHSALAAHNAYQQQTTLDQQAKPAILARDLMTTPVLSLPSHRTVSDAWLVMKQQGFRHIPITAADARLVGMVSDRDVLYHAPELIIRTQPSQASQRRLAEIMTARVISATPITDIREIARAMLDEQIHAVPILDDHRCLVGILTTRDLLRGIANHGPIELWT
jgi:acetoin utilization protein AcuB